MLLQYLIVVLILLSYFSVATVISLFMLMILLVILVTTHYLKKFFFRYCTITSYLDEKYNEIVILKKAMLLEKNKVNYYKALIYVHVIVIFKKIIFYLELFLINFRASRGHFNETFIKIIDVHVNVIKVYRDKIIDYIDDAVAEENYKKYLWLVFSVPTTIYISLTIKYVFSNLDPKGIAIVKNVNSYLYKKYISNVLESLDSNLIKIENFILFYLKYVITILLNPVIRLVKFLVFLYVPDKEGLRIYMSRIFNKFNYYALSSMYYVTVILNVIVEFIKYYINLINEHGLRSSIRMLRSFIFYDILISSIDSLYLYYWNFKNNLPTYIEIIGKFCEEVYTYLSTFINYYFTKFYINYNNIRIRYICDKNKYINEYKSTFYKELGQVDITSNKVYNDLFENQNIIEFKPTSIDTQSEFDIIDNINIFFLRKNKVFNKSRYSRNRQTYRTGFYLCILLNIILIIGLCFAFYKFSMNIGYFWWLTIIFVFNCFYYKYFKYIIFKVDIIKEEIKFTFNWFNALFVNSVISFCSNLVVLLRKKLNKIKVSLDSIKEFFKTWFK